MDTQELDAIARSIADSRDAIRAIGEEAQMQALFLERDRPYSSPPPSLHPVWSDELRAESARLRDEGLLPPGMVHPWETDLVAWPAADATHQITLAAQQAEQQAWADLVREFGEAPEPDLDHEGSETGWGVAAAQLLTARDYMLTYGHAGGDPTAQWDPAPMETRWAEVFAAHTLPDAAVQEDSAAVRATRQEWAREAQTPVPTHTSYAGALKAFLADKHRTQHERGMTW